ncbi:hypothetical protein F8M41_025742 [Gigaspora margarita]|uniref:Uncharacterized protein n=1 Tax=Gigaspora margarita TaxID=4874 RepID=A0A8H3XK18_GIGMA|nr:hypothetical protein F8M41_025742 [Gigaspora margarita]
MFDHHTIKCLVCQSFGGHYSVFGSSGNTALRSSQARRSFGDPHSFENNMSLTGSAESNELDSEAGMSAEALYKNTGSDSLNLNLNPSQVIGF